MKEKIKRFLKNGGLLLITAIVNFIIMTLFMIDIASEYGFQGCLIIAIIFIPWTLLFLEAYRFVQKEDRLIKLSRRLLQIAKETASELDRYIAIYGELPAEEESEKQNSEKSENEK